MQQIDGAAVVQLLQNDPSEVVRRAVQNAIQAVVIEQQAARIAELVEESQRQGAEVVDLAAYKSRVDGDTDAPDPEEDA